jgi:hypothetical protein
MSKRSTSFISKHSREFTSVIRLRSGFISAIALYLYIQKTNESVLHRVGFVLEWICDPNRPGPRQRVAPGTMRMRMLIFCMASYDKGAFSWD